MRLKQLQDVRGGFQQTIMSTQTFVNESADPAWCSHSDVCDAFLQQLDLLLYLPRENIMPTVPFMTDNLRSSNMSE